jgi:hypothetical protein
MSTQIVTKDGKDYPFLFCDHCKLEILDAEMANAIWLGDPKKEEGFRFDVGHVHKECDDAFQRAHRAPDGSQWFWQGLNHHLFMLLGNIGYDAGKGKHAKELLDGLSL